MELEEIHFRDFVSIRPRINETHDRLASAYEFACNTMKPFLRAKKRLGTHGGKMRDVPRNILERYELAYKMLTKFLDRNGYKMRRMTHPNIYYYWEKTGRVYNKKDDKNATHAAKKTT